MYWFLISYCHIKTIKHKRAWHLFPSRWITRKQLFHGNYKILKHLFPNNHFSLSCLSLLVQFWHHSQGLHRLWCSVHHFPPVKYSCSTKCDKNKLPHECFPHHSKENQLRDTQYGKIKSYCGKLRQTIWQLWTVSTNHSIAKHFWGKNKLKGQVFNTQTCKNLHNINCFQCNVILTIAYSSVTEEEEFNCVGVIVLGIGEPATGRELDFSLPRYWKGISILVPCPPPANTWTKRFYLFLCKKKIIKN